MSQEFNRCQALNNIPTKKLQSAIQAIENSQDDLSTKSVKLTAINRYAESNIPVEYWSLKMDRDFKGDPRLLDKFNDYTKDLYASYETMSSVCFAGNHGVGKTMTATAILKKASLKGYSCLYTTLSDIVSTMTQSSLENKYDARRELTMVDFLVIDEFDPRFMQSENAADLYARTLESVFRTRSQNRLPTIMCTNSPNVVESFSGPLKASVDSLMKGYMKVFPVTGTDFRKRSL